MMRIIKPHRTIADDEHTAILLAGSMIVEKTWIPPRNVAEVKKEAAAGKSMLPGAEKAETNIFVRCR